MVAQEESATQGSEESKLIVTGTRQTALTADEALAGQRR
jgi:hypothetical protein